MYYTVNTHTALCDCVQKKGTTYSTHTACGPKRLIKTIEVLLRAVCVNAHTALCDGVLYQWVLYPEEREDRQMVFCPPAPPLGLPKAPIYSSYMSKVSKIVP